MIDRLNTLVLDLFSRLQLQREEGQGAVEYVLILVAVVAAAAAITGVLTGKFTDLANSINLG